jgi:hypothetical protein
MRVAAIVRRLVRRPVGQLQFHWSRRENLMELLAEESVKVRNQDGVCDGASVSVDNLFPVRR